MTDKPHTQTTADIRNAVTRDESDWREAGAHFDRWLATIEAAAEQRGAERGWDEAITSAESLGHFDNHCSPDTCPDEMRNVNPYRADQMEGDE